MSVEDRWKGTNQALEALNLFGDTRQNKRNTVMDAYVYSYLEHFVFQKELDLRIKEITKCIIDSVFVCLGGHWRRLESLVECPMSRSIEMLMSTSRWVDITNE